MIARIDGVPKPRLRHLAVAVLLTAVAWYAVHWLGNRAPAFGAFIKLGEAAVIITGAWVAFQEIRPRTHERRDGDRRHSDRRKRRR